MPEEILFEQEQEEKRERLQSKIQYKETELYDKQQELNTLEKQYQNLQNTVIVDGILCVVIVFILFEIATNAGFIVYRLISWTAVTIALFSPIVGFIAYASRKVVNELPLYFWCKKEEKGNASNHDNYVYKIKEKRKEINNCTLELEELRNEYGSL